MTLPIYQRKHIEAWQASDLTQVAYCRRHRLNTKTFSNWLRIYRTEQASPESPSLIPVEIKPTALSSGSLWLRCSQGHTLELPTSVSPQWLGELLKCLD